MAADTERSEAVIEEYKKRKLAASALRRIHQIIHGFEKDRSIDVLIARFGVGIIIVILGIAAWFFLGGGSTTLS